jgi:glycosyltransferase involved in cell wall biosynthesis
MHVFLITQYFHPEIGAAASRWGDYVKLLIDKGHKVTVLCEVPNYPHGKIFDGYKNQWYKKEILSDNLVIIRSGVWANNRNSKIKILGNYLSFALTGLINSLKIKNYDLIIISSPPLFVGIIGIILKKIKKCIILLDLRDIWPESVIALGGLKSKWLLNLGRWLENLLYCSVDGYIFPVPGFINYFKKSFPEQLQKPVFNLMNGIDKEFINESLKFNKKHQKDFTVLYSGNLGLAQGLEVVIKTAELLLDYPIQFRLIGNGLKKELLINLAKSKKLNNISFEDTMPRTQLIKEISKANVCLVPLKNNKLFRNAIPSKIFEIMACSKPVILGVKGEAEKIIKNNNCGITVDPENSEKLKNAVLTYYNDKSLSKIHGENGVKYVTDYMQKEFLLSEFLFQLNNKAKVSSLNINI